MLQLEGKSNSEKLKVLSQLQKEHHWPDVPISREGSDNAKLQGSNPVAAMVDRKNGVPDKSKKRRRNGKTGS